MSIPDYQTIMLPLLKLTADGEEHRFRDAVAQLAKEFQLTKEELDELLPSGRQPVFHNRVGWARTYLAKAGLLEAPKRGYFRITDRGRDALSRCPSHIDNAFLKQFDEFVAFQGGNNEGGQTVEPETDGKEQSTPEESLEYAYQRLRKELADEVLAKVKNCSASFFEQLVVEVLVAMGYGGSLKDAGETVGKSGDEGIDGIIKEDRLGLDVIYVQAKRWENTVSRPEIQKFVGALQGKRAKKGVFITTSDFSKGAEEYSQHLDCKVVLIDGRKLSQFMVDFNVGVSTFASYEVKRIDMDYFDEE